jgi:hypothetical protein
MESNNTNGNKRNTNDDHMGHKSGAYKEYNSDKRHKKSNDLTHFINIPIEDPEFIKEYCLWCEDLKKQNLNDFYPELLQKHGKLHMTVCVLDLGEDKDKIDYVHQVLQSIQPEIQKIAEGKVLFNFNGYDTMGTINKARVIYAKMKADSYYNKLADMIHIIIKSLVDNGILKENKFKDTHIQYEKGKYSITVHMTLLNTLFLNKILKKRREKQVYNINATGILEYLKTRELPSAKIDRLHFSRMREDKKTEKYELIYSYDIY